MKTKNRVMYKFMLVMVKALIVFGQEVKVNFVEVTPGRFEKVRVCKVEVAEEIRNCIEESMKRSNCNLIRFDSSEIYTVIGSCECLDKNMNEENCYLIIYVKDIVFVDWLSVDSFEKLLWFYGGFFQLNGDIFYVYDKLVLDKNNSDTEKIFEKNCFFYKTTECKEVLLPVLKTFGFLREEISDKGEKVIFMEKEYFHSDEGWPGIFIEIQNGKVVNCNIMCKENDYPLIGTKIKIQ